VERILATSRVTLGTHYVDHEFGPHVVPVLTDTLEWFDEKVRFDRDVVGAVEAFDPVE
jgi:hypothetical protein